MTAAVLCKFSCLDKPAGIDGCLDAGFLKHVDYVFGADVSGCIGTKGTAAETAGVVKMKGYFDIGKSLAQHPATLAPQRRSFVASISQVDRQPQVSRIRSGENCPLQLLLYGGACFHRRRDALTVHAAIPRRNMDPRMISLPRAFPTCSHNISAALTRRIF